MCDGCHFTLTGNICLYAIWRIFFRIKVSFHSNFQSIQQAFYILSQLLCYIRVNFSWVFRCKVRHPGEWVSGTKSPPCAVGCRAFHFGWQVLSSCFDQQKPAIHPTKKTGIHLRGIQSIIRAGWMANIQKPGWLRVLSWKIFGGLLYIRLNVSNRPSNNTLFFCL